MKWWDLLALYQSLPHFTGATADFHDSMGSPRGNQGPGSGRWDLHGGGPAARTSSRTGGDCVGRGGLGSVPRQALRALGGEASTIAPPGQ